ncbi:MAG: PAAR domain-containing protein [Polyangiaceae bacterium]|nr:PAAR domain-containing protein [Polyangiaceae bacterium]
MGKPAARLGDNGSGHGCHHLATPAIEGSPDIFINGRPAVRKGHAYAPHDCPRCKKPKHSRKLKEGSPTVFFNDQPAGRIGDAIDCGGKVVVGSPNVFIGEPCASKTRKPFCETCACHPGSR